MRDTKFSDIYDALTEEIVETSNTGSSAAIDLTKYIRRMDDLWARSNETKKLELISEIYEAEFYGLFIKAAENGDLEILRKLFIFAEEIGLADQILRAPQDSVGFGAFRVAALDDRIDILEEIWGYATKHGVAKEMFCANQYAVLYPPLETGYDTVIDQLRSYAEEVGELAAIDKIIDESRAAFTAPTPLPGTLLDLVQSQENAAMGGAGGWTSVVPSFVMTSRYDRSDPLWKEVISHIRKAPTGSGAGANSIEIAGVLYNITPDTEARKALDLMNTHVESVEQLADILCNLCVTYKIGVSEVSSERGLG